jgi:hypothetical protein
MLFLPFETIPLLTSLPLASFIHLECSYRLEWQRVCKFTNKQKWRELTWSRLRYTVGLHNYTACNMKQFKCSKLPAEKQIFANVRIRCHADWHLQPAVVNIMKRTTAAWDMRTFRMLYLQYILSPLHTAYSLAARTVTTLQGDLYYFALYFFT